MQTTAKKRARYGLLAGFLVAGILLLVCPLDWVELGRRALYRWEVLPGEQAVLFRNNSSLWDFVVLPDDRVVVGGGCNPRIGQGTVWIGQGSEWQPVIGRNSFNGQVVGLSLVGGGEQLLVVAHNTPVTRWDTQTWKRVSTYPVGWDFVACSPDKKWCVTCKPGGVFPPQMVPGDPSILLYPLTSSGRSTVLPGQGGVLCNVAFSPKGEWLVSGGSDRMIRLRSTSADFPERATGMNQAPVTRICFHPEADSFVVADNQGGISIWRTEPLSCVTRRRIASSGIVALTVSPSGSHVVAAGDASLHVVEYPTLQLVRTLSGHHSTITRVRFLNHRKAFLSTSMDGTLREWDAAICFPEQTMRTH